VHDAETLGKKPVGYKAAGVIHWVSATHGVPVTIRRCKNLFNTQELPADASDLLQHVNPSSLEEFQGVVEPSVAAKTSEGKGKESEAATLGQAHSKL
jgi:glutaminyl-tRNA synthetase